MLSCDGLLPIGGVVQHGSPDRTRVACLGAANACGGSGALAADKEGRSSTLAGRRDGSASGKRMVKFAPPAGQFSTVMVPPCASTMRLTMERPRPAPPVR